MGLSIDKAMSRAKGHLKRGEISRAREIYAAILAEYPGNARAKKAMAQLGGAPGGQGIDLPQADAQHLLGLVQQGRHAEVLRTAEALGVSFPDSAFLWDMKGIANASLGRFAEAETCFRAVTRIKPDFAQAYNNLGNTIMQQGRLQEAATCYREASRLEPKLPEPHNGLGLVLIELGEPESAAEHLRHALELKPDYAEALNNLGNAMREMGRAEDAIALYDKALAVNGAYVEPMTNAAAVCRELGRVDEAVNRYQHALRIAPKAPVIHNALGLLMQHLRRYADARACYTKALELDPDYADAHVNYAGLLCERGEFQDAIHHCRKALELAPDRPDFHARLGACFYESGDADEAIAELEKADALTGGSASALCDIGNIHSEFGRKDEALDYYRRALECDPGLARAYFRKSRLKTYTADDPEIAVMQALAGSGRLSGSDQAHIEFALAKAFDDIDDVKTAFGHFSTANALRKNELGYTLERDSRIFDEIRRTFEAPGTLAVPEQLPQIDQVPIFIVGMSRSGTTLTEQILASHTEVHGAGELPSLRRAQMRARRAYPEDHAAMLLDLRRRYAEALTELGRNERFITDKMPFNFRLIGYIAQALPEARIVHMVRDPRAVCWSNYRQLFGARDVGFVYDLEDVSNYYLMYRDMMDFWHQRFPGRIYDLDYRALTDAPENTVSALLQFVGLDWQSQCLQFHRNKRQVRTASSQQVRKGIYRGSSDEWKRYQEFLRPMIDILERGGAI